MSGRTMTVAFVSASERVGGNTDQVVQYAAATLERHGVASDIILLRDYRVEPCGACGDCNVRTTPCAVADDAPALVDRLIAADGIVYAAPVHAFGLAHPMQIFLERAGVGHLRFARPLANKVGGVVVIGRRYNHAHVHAQLVNNVLLNRMIMVGSGYPVLLDGGAPGKVLEDEEGLTALTYLLDRMVSMMTLLRGTRASTEWLYTSSKSERERPAELLDPMLLKLGGQR